MNICQENKNEGKYLIGLDIGGTNVKLALVDLQGNIFISHETSVNYDNYATPIIQTVQRELSKFIQSRAVQRHVEEHFPHLPASAVQACGMAVSATGQIDVHAGQVIGTCGNLPSWTGTPLKSILENNYQLPVVVANDANCMVVGEAWRGAAQGYQHVVGITIGTGIGGGILVAGDLLTGKQGLAAELGHLPLYAGGVRCTCGQQGCAEQYISVTALHRRCQAVGEDFPNARKLCAGILSGTAHAKQISVFAAWRRDLAQFLVGLCHTFNPQLLLIGGGISQQEELLIEPLRELVLQQVMPGFRQNLEVKAAACGNLAGILGAAKLWLNRHRS